MTYPVSSLNGSLPGKPGRVSTIDWDWAMHNIENASSQSKVMTVELNILSNFCCRAAMPKSYPFTS